MSVIPTTIVYGSRVRHELLVQKRWVRIEVWPILFIISASHFR